MKTGAKDRAAKQSQYDFVFDDAIGFVQDQMLAGARLRCSAIPNVALQAAALTAFQPSNRHSVEVRATCSAVAAKCDAEETC